MTINSDQLTIEKLKKQIKELQAVVDRLADNEDMLDGYTMLEYAAKYATEKEKYEEFGRDRGEPDVTNGIPQAQFKEKEG